MNPGNPAHSHLPNWSGLGDRGHGVQFYSDEDDSSLAALLCNYAGAALITGEAAVVVATKAHLEALTACFASRGFDPGVSARQGRYVALSAEDTLAQFWAKGSLDVARFERVMDRVLTRAQASTGSSRSHVAVFVELVALLWMAGHAREALQLEDAWNGLLKAHSFSLCCAYPMQMFAGEDAGAFLRICAQHTHVFPAEPRSSRFLSWPNDRSTAADHP